MQSNAKLLQRVKSRLDAEIAKRLEKTSRENKEAIFKQTRLLLRGTAEDAKLKNRLAKARKAKAEKARQRKEKGV